MNELSRDLVCLLIKGGVEFWIERDRAENIIRLLSENCPDFIEFDKRIINKFEIVGIFTAADMEERTRRKNGQWKCKLSGWHDKNEKCRCIPNGLTKDEQIRRLCQ